MRFLFQVHRLVLSSLVFVWILGIISVFSLKVYAEKVPEPKVVTLNPDVKDYMRVLAGPPETVTMRAGLVVLAPGKSVGTHNTDS